MIFGAAGVTAVLVAAIGYLIASDVKGRAQGQVALIEARAQLAIAMIEAARAAYEPEPAQADHEIIPLPAALRAINHAVERNDERGWLAIAMDHGNGDGNKYVLMKGAKSATVDESDFELDE